MKPINLGVIGLGIRGRALSLILKQHGSHRFNIAAVCDTQANNVQQLVRELELSPESGCTGYRAILNNPDVEAVMVQTGAQTLAPIALEALRSGKHVLCDVPMLFTRQEAYDLVTEVEASGLVYAMAEQVRFANFVLQWRQHVEQGEIGVPLFIQGEYFHPNPGWYYERKVSAGVPWVRPLENPAEQAENPDFRKAWRNSFRHVIKYCSHGLSPLLKITGDRVTEVSCLAADARSYGDLVDALDIECALMRTAKGSVIRLVNSFTVPRHAGAREQSHHWFHITGSEGVLENARPGWGSSADTPAWNMAHELIRRRDGSYAETHYGWDRPDNPWGTFEGGHGALETFVFEDFYNAIRFGAKSELDIYSAIESVLPGIIAAESVETGGTMLEVPNLRPQASLTGTR